MAKKRKISIRKVLQVLFTLVVAVCCVVAMVSASKIEDAKMLDRVEVQINSAKKYHFIEEKQILDETINNRNIDILHMPVGKLDMKSMEQVLRADPWVADAQLYVDNAKVLHITVTQRLPIARIFEQGGNSYYMDSTLSVMPLSPNFIYYTSVVTNMPVLTNDSAGKVVKRQVAKMVNAIQADTFWSAQISQIIVDSDLSFQLIPVLGDQRIIFGDTSRMKEKFSNLYTFYKGVLNKIGWEHYDALDVRFRGQVIASPALPYKGPVDKAIVNMNWVNSIVETEARKDSLRAAGEPKQVADEPKKEAKPEAKAKDKPKEKEKPKEPVKSGKDKVKKEEKKEEKKVVKKGKETKKTETNNKEKSKDKHTVKYTYPDNKDKK